MDTFITYLEGNQPIATILTGIFAVIAVIISQVWLDSRQRRDHQHTSGLKEREMLLTRKEQLIDSIGAQIKDISQVEVIFESWLDNFEENYSNSKISALLREIDINLDKIHLLVVQYFPGHINLVNNIINESQGFLEITADFSMTGRFGKDDLLKLNHIEIIEICNAYAVSYMQLSKLLVERKEH